MKYSFKKDLSGLSEITSLVNRAYRGSEGANRWTGESHLIEGERITNERLSHMIEDESHDFIIGSEKGRVLCCISVKYCADLVEFGCFAVDPDLHGSGLGKQLLNYAEKHASSRKQKYQVTVVSPNTSLINFYEKRGYHTTGVHMPFPGRYINTVKVAEFDMTILQKEFSN
jgi:N-acetylglutamate synthase-like GNAT family acetyltransferase